MMDASMVMLRPMRSEDVKAAHDLEQRVYRQAWSEQVFLDELAQASRHYVVAEVDGVLAGYGGVMLVGEEAHITTVVVDPAHRQGRIATRLMLALIDDALAASAGALTLEVRVSNEAAQALYRRFGMAPVGVRKQYYRDEDALIMWVHDIASPVYRERLASIRETVA
jgi:[ribosomal protein S18]-alanine N-acetyltransferase